MIKNIRILVFFCLTIASACSSNVSMVKYYSNYSGSINYAYDYIETFHGLLHKEDLGNYLSYYKVYFSENSKPLKAEGFDKQGNLLAILKFDSKGRQIQSERKTQSCKYIYNDSEQRKKKECFKENGKRDFMTDSIYKNNLISKMNVFNSLNQLDYFMTYDYVNNKRNVYLSNGDLKESVPLELPPEK